jgi:hypothetical protein
MENSQMAIFSRILWPEGASPPLNFVVYLAVLASKLTKKCGIM